MQLNWMALAVPVLDPLFSIDYCCFISFNTQHTGLHTVNLCLDAAVCYFGFQNSEEILSKYFV